jgi:hypothetical protein
MKKKTKMLKITIKQGEDVKEVLMPEKDSLKFLKEFKKNRDNMIGSELEKLEVTYELIY